MKHVLYSAILVAALIGCATAPPVEEMTGELYIEQGISLLGEPADDHFWNLVNREMAGFPEETEVLLDAYADRQIRIIRHYIGEDNVFRILFHLRNLAHISSFSKEKAEELKAEIASSLTSEASNLFRTSLPGSGYAEIPKESDLLDVTEFSKVLAEINVVRNYRTSEDIERTSYPSFAGSGFIVDERHIVTAFHVVESVFRSNTDSYEIFVSIDGVRHDGVSIKAWDSLSDLALLELPHPIELPFPVFELIADSDNLIQGSEIYTYGHHYGFNTTLTKGIVSALRRRAPEVGYWLQIDATVAPGASGGPVIGLDNKIYGVVVAGIAYEDINFAVPSEILLKTYPALASGYNVNRPWLGLVLSDKDHDDQGVTVKSILPSSPLQSTVLHAGDRLLAINGETFDTVEQAQQTLMHYEAGNIVHITTADDVSESDGETWIKLSKRPDYPIYSTTFLFDRFDTLYTYYGISVGRDSVAKQQISTRNGTIDLNLYRVVRVDEESYLYSRGVRPWDTVGFLTDYLDGRRRTTEILHIPKNLNLRAIKDIRNYIYTLSKGALDENIL